MPRSLYLVLMLFVVVGLYTSRYVFRPAPPAPTTAADDPRSGHWQSGHDALAPDFSLTTLDGDTLRLSDQRGHLVVLNFWATWCAPCREETPALVDIQNEYADRGVRIVGVSIDEEGEAVVRPFVDAFGVNYPIVIDDGTVEPLYEDITGVPTSYIIEPDGRIAYFMPGALTRTQLRLVLDRLLAAPAS